MAFYARVSRSTLDSDSEFRLVVMAGIAQDEVRKLSERLKSGLRWAAEKHIIAGDDDGQLGPQGPATRMQAAQMLK